jgi:glycosyltransferase involved in cell wall biosynthesis
MFNEELCAADVINEARRVISSLPLEYEIIAVNDCSSDGTAAALQQLASRDNKIKIVRNHKRLGLGGSLRAGFRQAAGEVIFYTDADLPCRMDELKTAIAIMEKQDADIVCAYKIDLKQYGLKRSLYSLAYNKLINTLFRINLKDVNFSFKLFRGDKLDKLMLESDGSFINAELFIKARRAGYKIIEFPARYLPRNKGNSKLDNCGNIVKIIRELLAFAILKRRP